MRRPAGQARPDGGAIDLDDLRALFIARCRTDILTVSPWLGEAPPAAGDMDVLRRIAHRLAGSASLFGFPALGAAAERLEDEAGRPDPCFVQIRAAALALTHVAADLCLEPAGLPLDRARIS